MRTTKYRDWAGLLKKYLEDRYGIKIRKGPGRSHLTFESGEIVHVRGSKGLPKSEEGSYYLQKEDFERYEVGSCSVIQTASEPAQVSGL